MSGDTKRVLIVTGQKAISPIRTKSGGEGTLYEVYAKDEAGEIIEEPLRAFAELEVGVPIEYTVSRYNHPRHGTSYTLLPPPRQTQARLREVERRLEALLGWATEQGFVLPEAEGRKSRRKELDPSPPAEEEAPPGNKDPRPAPSGDEDDLLGPADSSLGEPEAPENPELDEKFGKDAPF